MQVMFGGSFNPPTIAHEAIICDLSKRFDKVIVVPNGKNYSFRGKKLGDTSVVVDMLKIISSKFSNVVISEMEQSREFLGTYQTLKDLDHPVFAMGDDLLETISSWINAKELLCENSFIIYTRKNNSLYICEKINNDVFLSKYLKKYEIVELDYKDVSSSLYRCNKNLDFVSKEIKEYIDTNKLYEEDFGMFKYNYLKVANIISKVSLGKPLENAKRIIQLANDATKASIVVFPRRSLTGYSLKSWVNNQEFKNNIKDALEYIVKNSTKQVMIVGLPFENRGVIYDCAAVIQNKQILGIVTCENVDYEEISFKDYSVPFGNIEFKNQDYDISFSVNLGLDVNKSNTSDIVFVLDDARFELRKNDLIKSILKSKSHSDCASYIYSSVSSSDTASDEIFSSLLATYECSEEIIFNDELSLDDKVSFTDVDIENIHYKKNKLNKNQKRNVSVSFELSESDEYVLQRLPDDSPFVPKSDKEYADIINVATIALKHRLDYIGINKVAIGISGGLDSTLALLFAYSTFKKYNMPLKNILAVTMPGLGTGSKSKNIATNLMNKLGVSASEVSIKKEALGHLKLLGHSDKKDVTYENVQARIRTMYLMNLANQEGAIVLGTGDMSEIALGWSTFNGDQMSMYNLNAGLPKTTIKALVKYYINICPEVKNELNKVYHAIITPELTGSNQATEDRIGKYQINDFLMYHLFEKGASISRLLFLISSTFNISTKEAKIYYDRFMSRFNHNQYKRIASAEGIGIFSVSLCVRNGITHPGDMK